MKKFLILAAVLCCTFGLFAKFGDPQPAYIQPTFGIGLDFEYNANMFGLTAGVDIDWNVWEKAASEAHDGSGKMYAGLDVAVQWWVPTENGFKHHNLMIPLQGSFSYEFDTTKMQNAGPLKAVGPWLSTGIGFNIFTKEEETLTTTGEKKKETKAEFEPSFVYGIGASLLFEGNWVLKAGIGGNKGLWNNNRKNPWTNDYFMVEAAYRF